MKYFGIRELIPCVDGHCKDGRCGYDESTIVKVPSEVIMNAIALAENVLDPAREQLGMPIKVNSGYRCPLKNKAVGGVENSQHLRGEAADISLRLTAYSLQDGLMKLARIIVENGKFDQLIIYPTFLHVSYKRNGVNRHKVLKKTSTGYAPVSI